MRTKTATGIWSAVRAGAFALGLGGALLAAGCTPGPQGSASPGTASPAPAAHSDHAGHDHAGHDHSHEGDSAIDFMKQHAMGTAGLDALKEMKGREFDVAFLSQMIAHHEAAVTMAEQALKSAKDEATKVEARKVVENQTAEIKQMTGWLREWYKTGPSSEQQALVRKDMEAMMAMPVTDDRMYYEMMIPHHQGAIDMSALVPERSERPEMKKLAEQITRDQTAEIVTYRRALAEGDGGQP